MSLVIYLVLSGILFSIGAVAVLTRRNAIIAFMGVELMLNAANLMLVTFSRIHGDLHGQVIAFYVMVVAAAEVVIGDRKSTRLNSSHVAISYAVFCLKKKKQSE